ncbi:MAG TPA: MFS transporter [Gaiellaceae bacterium]
MTSKYRWAVLAAGTFAQTTYSAIWFGVAVMAPYLRDRDHLSLAETGFLISSSLVGSLASLILWGLATDRIGERLVLFVGLMFGGAALIAAAYANGFWPLAGLLALAGAAGASVQSASGRAVMHWFAPAQRGLALALRQTAIPLSGFAIALALPPIVHAGGVKRGFLTMGIACLAGAVVGALVLREGPRPDVPEGTLRGPAPIRDRRIWQLSLGSALLIAPQLCVTGFTVLYLHERRGMSPGGAAVVLAVMQALAVAGRITAGRWSDVRGSRLGPLRAIALAAFVLVTLMTILLNAPLPFLVPVLIAAGVLSMSWNSLSFAAAVELAGHGRSGSAIGLQQTLLNGPAATYPGLFGALVAASSWRVGFAVLAVFPLVGWRVLRALPG